MSTSNETTDFYMKCNSRLKCWACTKPTQGTVEWLVPQLAFTNSKSTVETLELLTSF